jgi:RNA polymerase sigma factor (sigma-70 family)
VPRCGHCGESGKFDWRVKFGNVAHFKKIEAFAANTPVLSGEAESHSLRGPDVTDGQLLKDFIAENDESAFTALVKRHGPMVMGLCRRVLGESADAEDAFQATFMVLARKAASVGRPDLLGNWLYGVAYRTALEARSKLMRRQAKEKQLVQEPSEEPTPDVVWQEVRDVLDEEVSRLPDKYRVPFVLCYLQGQTNEEAASRLGCPKGTILSRLATARERLRARLIYRGIALSVGSLGLLLTEQASAAVPSSLSASTVQAATNLAAGLPLATVVPGQVAALTEGVLRAMFLSKLKIAAAGIVTVVLLGISAVMLAQANQEKDNPNADRERIQGSWQVVSVKDGGRQPPQKEVEGAKMVIAKDTLVLSLPDGKKLENTYHIDPSRDPKWIDVTDTKTNRTTLGLYRLKGDDLTIVLDEGGERGRSTDFVSEQGSPNDLLIVLKREKK